MNKLVLQISLCVILSLFFWSCEKEKSGIIDSSYSPPLIEATVLDVSSVNLDTTSEPVVTKLPNGRFKISVTVYAQANDPDGTTDIKQIAYRLYQPGSPNAFSSGILTPDNSIIHGFSGTISITISRTDVGIYTIEVYAIDKSNFTSNALQIPLNISKINSVPRVFNLSVPDTLVRPNSGSRLVLFTMSVVDSDGYKDISEVFFTADSSSTPTVHQPMFDDGNISATGDSIANDGRFSRIIPLTHSALLGKKEFHFYARDKSGALSDPISHFIIFIPE